MPTPDVEWALAELRDRRRQRRYKLHRRYYDGDHRMLFATEKFRKVFGAVFRSEQEYRELDFSDNICGTVVDVMVERMEMSGWTTSSGNESDPLPQRAEDLWERNRMTLRANELHREAFVTGDGFVIVWPDAAGEAVIWPQRAEQMAVEYDEDVPGRIARAAKSWRTADRRTRLNLYFADRIEKYVSTSAARSTGGLPRADGFAPVAEAVGHEYGRVPVFHFPNKRLYEYGVSELKDIVPLQDALTKTGVDLLVAMEFQAFVQRWATGLTVEIDPETGLTVDPDFTHGPNRLWWTASDTAKFGEFASTDLKQFLEAAETWRSEIARVSGTPLHLLYIAKGDWPSGESMKSAEVRFTKKLGDRESAFGIEWWDVVRFALRVEGSAPNRSAAAVWDSVSPRSERELLEELLLKQALGVPSEQLLQEKGYPAELIARWVASGQLAKPKSKIILPTSTGRLRIPDPVARASDGEIDA